MPLLPVEKAKLTPLRMATLWNAASSSFVIGYSTGSKCRSAHGEE